MREQTARAATAGLVTGLAGIATSLVTTSLLNERANPIVAVAESVIQITPGSIAEGLIRVVRQWDKPLLVAGTTTVLLLLCALAGLLYRRRAELATLLFLVLGTIAGVAALTRPQATSTAIMPVVVGVVTWVVVLPVLMDPAPEQMRDRRDFLRRAGLVAGLAVVAGVGARLLGATRRQVEAARSRLKLAVTKGTVPAGAQIGPKGVQSWRVPNSTFYRIDTALTVPSVNPDTWSLRIHGEVENEMTLTYSDLLDRRLTEDWVTLCCVSNPIGGNLIGNAWWSGVRIADLLAEAKPLPSADAVLQTSVDGWNCGTPLEVLTDGRNAMLAVAMNGEPLPLEHGFPVRMVVPGLYGYVSATKWVVDLEVTRFSKFTAYWTKRGWAAKGPVKTESRIDVPRSGAQVPAGKLKVGGVAWAQHTGIAKVEIRLDGGTWQEAEVGATTTDDSWVQWAGEIDVSSGRHQLAVRATDKSGYTQTGARTSVVPDGATGWHTVGFDAG